MIESEKNPRFWSSRYWAKKKVSEVLKEVVKPVTNKIDEVKENIKPEEKK